MIELRYIEGTVNIESVLRFKVALHRLRPPRSLTQAIWATAPYLSCRRLGEGLSKGMTAYLGLGASWAARGLVP